ncbi:hypothetical protein IAT40_002865 [Kwoniella sp. CBS 6097]
MPLSPDRDRDRGRDWVMDMDKDRDRDRDRDRDKDRDRGGERTWASWRERHPDAYNDPDRRDRDRDRDRYAEPSTSTSAFAGSSSVNPYAPSASRGQVSGGRSRSPDSNRSRQASGSSTGISQYRTDHHGGSRADYEPGEISHPPTAPASLLSRERERERDPREAYQSRPSYSHDLPAKPPYSMAPQSSSGSANTSSRLEYWPRKVSSNSVSVSVDRPRSRDHSPSVGSNRDREMISGKEGSVTGALEGFSKAMHSTLVSTSAHALALSHFTRLTQFPYTNPTSPAFEDAQRRVRDAERTLNEKMASLHSSFTELMRRTVGRVGEGGIGALEMDGIKERLRKLEELSSSLASTSTAPVPPPPADAPPKLPPAPDESSGSSASTQHVPPAVVETPAIEPKKDAVERTRGRLKAMLNDIITRLERVEDTSGTFDDRLFEVEGTLMIQESDSIDEDYGWGQLEDRRDPDGKLRGIKRKQRDYEQEQEPEVIAIDGDGENDDMELDESSMPDVDKGKGSVESMQREMKRMASDLKVLYSKTSAKGQNETPQVDPSSAAEVSALRDQVARMSAQIAEIQAQASASTIPGSAGITSTPALPSQSTLITLQNQMATLAAERQQIIAEQQQQRPSPPPSNPVVNLAPIEEAIGSLKEQVESMGVQMKDLVSDKVARSSVYGQISTGVTRLADNIKRCRTEINQQKTDHSAFMIAYNANIATHKRETELLQAEVSSLRDQSAKRAEQDKTTSQWMMAMANELKNLRTTITELRDGREKWTKEVMEACLDAVKEEVKAAKVPPEEYARIAKREIGNSMREFIAKTRGKTATPVPPANRSTSEPIDGKNTTGNPAPQADSTANASASASASPATTNVAMLPTLPTLPESALPSQMQREASLQAQSKSPMIVNSAAASGNLTPPVPGIPSTSLQPPAIIAPIASIGPPSNDGTASTLPSNQSTSAAQATQPVPNPQTSDVQPSAPARPTLSQTPEQSAQPTPSGSTQLDVPPSDNAQMNETFNPSEPEVALPDGTTNPPNHAVEEEMMNGTK